MARITWFQIATTPQVQILGCCKGCLYSMSFTDLILENCGKTLQPYCIHGNEFGALV